MLSRALLPLALCALLPMLLCPGECVNNTTEYCSTIPLNPIITCNVTCDLCSQQGRCSTCQPYLRLSDSVCNSPPDERITYNQYFFKTDLNGDKSLVNFKTKEKGVLTNSDLFRLCIASLYRFDVVGLFSSQDELIFTQTYPLQVSEIALNFRVFFTVNDISIKVLINQKLLYETIVRSGFTVDLVTNTTTNKTGVIQVDPSKYIDSVFTTVRTGMLPVGDTVAIIRIVIENADNTQARNVKFWGINHLSVAARRCMTCVSAAIQQFAAALGIIIGVSCGIVLVLLVVLKVYFAVKGAQHKNNLRKQFSETQRKFTAVSSKNIAAE